MPIGIAAADGSIAIPKKGGIKPSKKRDSNVVKNDLCPNEGDQNTSTLAYLNEKQGGQDASAIQKTYSLSRRTGFRPDRL